MLFVRPPPRPRSYPCLTNLLLASLSVVYAASVSRQSEVAVDGHGFVEPTVVTCLVPSSANLTPLLRVSFPDFDLLPTSTL
ncbi:hypothetical protein QL093DRAFT_2389936 [Fusarium oxysporum]|nr:hypothetical protein QL093DRAFT_2389936 [Fusarium oxysporum]